jgi:hypothetical protein
MVERFRFKPNKPIAPAARSSQLVSAGRLPLIRGEQAAEFKALFERACTDFNPSGSAEEKDVHDFAYYQWDVLRLRRLKADYITVNAPSGLRQVLADLLDNLPAVGPLIAEITRYEAELARLDRRDPDCIGIKKRLDQAKLELAQKRQVQLDELVADWLKRKPEAIARVDEILAGAALTIDAAVAVTLSNHFETIERLDRMIGIAEARANAARQELFRYRTILGPVLEAKPKVIKAASNVTAKKGKADE